jgi:hypothetical protein
VDDRAAQRHAGGYHAEEAPDREPGHEDEREDEVHPLVIDIRAGALEDAPQPV